MGRYTPDDLPDLRHDLADVRQAITSAGYSAIVNPPAYRDRLYHLKAQEAELVRAIVALEELKHDPILPPPAAA